MEKQKNWFARFLQRSKTLSIHKPKVNSLSIAINFNKNNVNLFFNNLAKIFASHNIYNVDEKGVSTVLKSDKEVAKRR